MCALTTAAGAIVLHATPCSSHLASARRPRLALPRSWCDGCASWLPVAHGCMPQAAPEWAGRGGEAAQGSTKHEGHSDAPPSCQQCLLNSALHPSPQTQQSGQKPWPCLGSSYPHREHTTMCSLSPPYLNRDLLLHVVTQHWEDLLHKCIQLLLEQQRRVLGLHLHG